MDASAEPAGKKRRLDEPHVRTAAYILRKHKGKPPSLTIHLHPTHFRFDSQDGSFAYDSPMKFVIGHLRKQTVPHEMMKEMLESNVPFYDGCLIVEVHNHRSKEGKDKGRHDSANDDDAVRFSMHNYTEHVTPSPMVPYPSKAARTDATPAKNEGSSGDMAAPERPKEKEGPKITTIVLQPTPLSQHNELLILASTPASDVRSKKRGSDGAIPSSAQPLTPQLSVPPTPVTQTSRGALTQSQKMCLEEGDLYSFQADLLVATEPPLFLEPVDNPQDAQKVIDMLQHPAHQEQPPSPKTRKRTTAEVAADDAQAAETERRMLIMDERIKPIGTGAAANENQGAAASLGFSRFKTIDMVRQKLEEAERQKKEDEMRATMEREQQQQNAAQQQQAILAQKNREMMMANAQAQAQQQQNSNQAQLMQQRRQEVTRQRMAAQAQANQAAQMNSQNPQNHAHPLQNGLMQGQPQPQHQSFQQANQASMPQSSPIVRQQTPMMNSSPMMGPGGFSMAQTSSQGAGSPTRPTSAALQHSMQRQASQQQHGSRHNTPQIPQGTPSMGQVVPNRQMTQTPRMPPGSPGVALQHGTPTSMPMQTPHMGANGFTPEQMAMLQQRALSQSMQANGVPAGSPPGNMTPEQIQQIQYSHRMQQQNEMMKRNALQQAQQQLAQGNPQPMNQLKQQHNQAFMRHRQQVAQQQQQQMLQQQQQQSAQMHGTPAPAGSPGGMPHQTPQMNHAHPTPNMQDPQQQAMHEAQMKANHIAQMRAQQQQARQAAEQVVRPLMQRYGGLHQIPQHVLGTLQPQVQQMVRQNLSQQAARQQQALNAQRLQQQNGNPGGAEQVPGQPPNPEYMHALRRNQVLLMQQQMQQQQNQQQQQGGMNNIAGMSFGMGGQQNYGGQQGGGGGTNDLNHHIAAMANALPQGPQQGRQGGGMQ